MRKTATATATAPAHPPVPGQLALFEDCYLCAAPVTFGEGARLGDELLCPACAVAQGVLYMRRRPTWPRPA